ncbi:glycine betaine ABC transporter substrate-binding protein [Thalassoglobus sp. JC818]|uniref:glycine betaine ABC transporter substrate-binding protein n=1 Tax=Thalassoglobus sp. JC818 TaxID=3232136 RepID=UPI00345AA9DF
MSMKNVVWFASGCVVLLVVTSLMSASGLRVAAKGFTESVTLAEIASALAIESGNSSEPVTELGGTQVLWSALVSGEIDVYPEYTGTLRQEIFRGQPLPDDESLEKKVEESGVSMTAPLGFNNTYAIAMKRSRAEEFGIEKISDLSKFPQFKYAFSNEFMDRGDGWPSLKRTYDLSPADIRGIQHTLAYRALDAGEIDVADAYATDPHILEMDLKLLKDDRNYFPKYDAVYLYRTQLEETNPEFVKLLKSMEGKLSDSTMLRLNEAVEIDELSEPDVASQFVNKTFGFNVKSASQSLTRRIWKTSLEHLFLVVISLSAAILVGIPAGIIAAKTKLPGQIILGTAEIIQTIPGLALLVFMGVLFIRVGLPSIGAFPVMVALFLYSLLPIIRNTMTGLTEIPKSLIESATALGLGPAARLRLVELPLSAPMILAGIKTTAVINVGYAALGGLIGAGGYGQPIMTGLRLNSEAHMLEGAIPAAIMAISVKYVFEAAEKFLVSPGLRVR